MADEQDPVDRVVAQAGRLAGWLAKTSWQAAGRLPGGEAAQRQFRKAEKAVLDQVHKRLDEEGTFTGKLIEAPPAVVDGHVDPVRSVMAELLRLSTELGREQGRHHLFMSIVRQLVPDEARILAALSDGEVYALVHVAGRSTLGGPQRIVLRNASSVGRAAGVMLPDLVPDYVTRLLSLGVVQTGPEDQALSTQYDILLTEDRVRTAETEVRTVHKLSPRYLKRTVKLSTLGTQFWDAARPG
ncbi:Abi-alpha family protein [Kibdelosporangium aridum]|uniref:Abi-alpha family protein n=1 Tax=Kibdelosporangium aridum TaxID=2030 RepID=UPI0005278A8A